jgi:hypothetical protein
MRWSSSYASICGGFGACKLRLFGEGVDVKASILSVRGIELGNTSEFENHPAHLVIFRVRN